MENDPTVRGSDLPTILRIQKCWTELDIISMDLFYEYRDRMINVMSLQYNEGRMVGYYESSFGTQINVKQIEILRLLKDE